MAPLSPRLASLVDALPLHPSTRVLEIGCGHGVAVEDLVLVADEEPFDLAFAVRVGALDGRYPRLEQPARARIRDALVPGGRLFIDGHESALDASG